MLVDDLGSDMPTNDVVPDEAPATSPRFIVTGSSYAGSVELPQVTLEGKHRTSGSYYFLVAASLLQEG